MAINIFSGIRDSVIIRHCEEGFSQRNNL